MLKAQFVLLPPNGNPITIEQTFSPFMIYEVRNGQECYILIPKLKQKGLESVIIVATEAGIRICRRDGWPKKFVAKIRQAVECEHNQRFVQISYSRIPTDLQYSIATKIIEQIYFQQI